MWTGKRNLSLSLNNKIDQSGELVKLHNIQNVSKLNPSKHGPTGTYYESQDRKGLFNHLNYEEHDVQRNHKRLHLCPVSEIEEKTHWAQRF